MKIFTKYLFALTLIIALSLNHTFASSKSDDKKVIHEKTFQIASGKKLNVNVDAGDVIITVWDKLEVYIKVIGNDNAADKYDYTFNGTSEEVTITG